MHAIFRGAVLAALAVGFWGIPQAQPYPARPLRFVLPFPPGGGSDFLSRIIGPKITENWGQPVIVDNRPGGSGVIAMEIGARASPDGYTILLADVGALGINPHIFRKLPYDPVRDFQPITKIADFPLICAAHPSLRVASLKEFVAAVRATPGGIHYASAGNGSMLHLATELLAKRAGIELKHVPYKGGSPAANALLSNQVGFACMTTAALKPFVDSGRIRALAVSSAQRARAMPELPTVAEQGYPGYEATQWVGMLVPRATPRAIVDRLHAEVARVLELPDVRERLVSTGAEPIGNTPEAFAAQIRASGALYGKLAAEIGLTPH
ncbi:MAG: tripartite tricarboxylate transporter substrate binding protein [Betaproteobacteria bacterium]|nr:tripartite tricarboxylate transporter substrate binding protein [Betaproteobacteria bacterium]